MSNVKIIGKKTKFTEDAAKLAGFALHFGKEILNFNHSLRVEIKHMKLRNYGLYYPKLNLIDLSTNKTTLGSMLITLSHEMVHAEQFHEGRLQKSNEFMVYMWKGKKHKLTTEEQDYRNLPWEIEAWERQNKVADYIFNKIVGK